MEPFISPICVYIGISGIVIFRCMSHTTIISHHIGKLSPLTGIQKIRNVGWSLNSKRAINLNYRLSLFAAFGGNQYYAIGGTRTVDGCCCTIFQNLNGFNIVRVDRSQTIVAKSTVYYIQRFCRTKGSCTTYQNIHICTCYASLLNDINTRHTALQGGSHVGRHGLDNLFI